MSDQDKNLPASARKLQKAREDGQIARSRDFGHLAAIAAGGGVIVAAAPTLSGWLMDMLAQALRFNAASVQNTGFMGERLGELTLKMLAVVLPMGALMMLVALGASIAIGGWVWTFKPMTPNLGKLNPLSGIGRVFSKQQMIDALKASLLALILGGIGAMYLRANVNAFGGALSMPLPGALSHAGNVILGGLLLLLLALALFAAIDVPLQKHLHVRLRFADGGRELRFVDQRIHFGLGVLRCADRIFFAEDAGRGHHLDHVGAVLDLLAHLESHGFDAVGDAVESSEAQRRRQPGEIGVTAGGADAVPGRDDARTARTLFVDRATQGHVDEVRRTQIAHRRESGQQGALGIEMSIDGHVDRAVADQGLVIIARIAGDMRVAVDQARQQRGAAQVDQLRAFGDRQRAADRGDAPAFDQHHGVTQRLVGDPIDQLRRADRGHSVGGLKRHRGQRP